MGHATQLGERCHHLGPQAVRFQFAAQGPPVPSFVQEFPSGATTLSHLADEACAMEAMQMAVHTLAGHVDGPAEVAARPRTHRELFQDPFAGDLGGYQLMIAGTVEAVIVRTS